MSVSVYLYAKIEEEDSGGSLFEYSKNCKVQNQPTIPDELIFRSASLLKKKTCFNVPRKLSENFTINSNVKCLPKVSS